MWKGETFESPAAHLLSSYLLLQEMRVKLLGFGSKSTKVILSVVWVGAVNPCDHILADRIVSSGIKQSPGTLARSVALGEQMFPFLWCFGRS